MLKTLWLTDNCIGEEGAVAIGEALRVNRSALTRLSLFRNSIRDKDSVATAATLSSALASQRETFSRFSPCTARRGANHLSQTGVVPGGRAPNHRSPIAKRPPREKSDRHASGVDSPPLVAQEEQSRSRRWKVYGKCDGGCGECGRGSEGARATAARSCGEP